MQHQTRLASWTLASAASDRQDPLWTLVQAHDDAASGGVRDIGRRRDWPEWWPVRASVVAVTMVSTIRATLGMQQHHAVSKVEYSR